MLFIVGSIVVAIALFLFSKKQEDWKHEPKLEGHYYPGKLKNLAESLKHKPLDSSENSSLFNMISSTVKSACFFNAI